MSFKFSEEHIARYMSEGYTVFRGILPASLIKDLRREAEKGRAIARAGVRGPQAQRIQPIGKFDLDPKPFRDYAELPELLDALRQVISPDAEHGDPNMLGILLEPADAPWCTDWHRDITADKKGIDPVSYEYWRYQRRVFNQVNCALYDDSSTWYVPASHNRDDLPGEKEHQATYPSGWQTVVEGMTNDELEQRNLDYCRDMPRAICLNLSAGDYGLYRPLGWHIGNYAPYRIRATLHDAIWTPESKKFYEEWQAALAANSS